MAMRFNAVVTDACSRIDVLVDLAAWRLNTIRHVLRDGEANTALLIPNPRGPER